MESYQSLAALDSPQLSGELDEEETTDAFR